MSARDRLHKLVSKSPAVQPEQARQFAENVAALADEAERDALAIEDQGEREEALLDVYFAQCAATEGQPVQRSAIRGRPSRFERLAAESYYERLNAAEEEKK